MSILSYILICLGESQFMLSTFTLNPCLGENYLFFALLSQLKYLQDLTELYTL